MSKVMHTMTAEEACRATLDFGIPEKMQPSRMTAFHDGRLYQLWVSGMNPARTEWRAVPTITAYQLSKGIAP